MCKSIMTGKDPLARSVRFQYNRTPCERAPQAKNYHRPYQEEWIHKFTHNSCSSWSKVQFVKGHRLGVPKTWLWVWALAFCVWQSLMAYVLLRHEPILFCSTFRYGKCPSRHMWSLFLRLRGKGWTKMAVQHGAQTQNQKSISLAKLHEQG